MKKKLLSLLLSLVMVVSLLPASVFAANAPRITKFTKLWASPALVDGATIGGKPEGTFFQLGADGETTGKTGFDAACYDYRIYVSANTDKVRAAGTSSFNMKNAFSYSDAAKASLYTVGEGSARSYIAENLTTINAFCSKWYNAPIKLTGEKTKAVIELFANKTDTTPTVTYTFTFIRQAMDADALRGILENLNVSSLKWPTDCDYVNKLKANYDALSSADKAELAITVTELQGSGTKEAPYKLTSAADLVKLSNHVAAGGDTKDTYFVITTDITLPTGWTPIGSLKEGKTWASNLDKSGFNAFSGIIDGDDHTITVPKGSKTMLGAVAGGKLSNLNIYGEKIDGYGVVEYYYVDRANPVKVEIDNVTLKSGTHTKYSGFIGGYASGVDVVIIRNSTVEAGVVIGDDGTYPEWAEELKGDFNYPWGPTGLKMNDMIGSFGGCVNGTIENCTSAAKVYGRNYVGGITGFKGQSMGDCITRNCSFTGEVYASGKFAGGIVGGGYSAVSAPNTPATTVEACVFTGKVTGATNVGGIFGGEELLKQCWNNGIGYIRGNYSTGTITATDKDGVKGGIIGYMNSLDRYNVIANNYYLNGSADKGIGSVNEVNVETKSDEYKRVDDPLGADAEKLTAAFTADELTNGSLVSKLNAAVISSPWKQGESAPVLSGEKRVVRLSCPDLNTMTASKIKQGGALQTILSKKVTVTYSDASTEEIMVKDCALTGLDPTKTGYQLCTISYNGYSLVFGVNIVTGGTAPSEVDTVTVSVSVLGDTLHELTADRCHTLAAGNLTPWVTDLTVTLDKGATVLDALVKACSAQGIKLGVMDSSYGGKYINSVTSAAGVALTDSSNKASDGKSYCGWMFSVNGTMPMTTVDATALTDGAKLCLYFEDDYSLAYVDSAEKAIDAVVATDCRTIKAAEDAVRYLSPVAISRISNYAKLQEALKGLDKIDHKGTWKVTTPATAAKDGLEELICDNCGHVLDSKTIPATGGVKTGDQGIMLFAGLGMAALLGLAVIPAVRRKKI